MTAPGNTTSESPQPAIVATTGPARVPAGPHKNFFAPRQSQLASQPRTAAHGQPTRMTGSEAALVVIAAAALALLTPAAIRLTRRQWRVIPSCDGGSPTRARGPQT